MVQGFAVDASLIVVMCEQAEVCSQRRAYRLAKSRCEPSCCAGVSCTPWDQAAWGAASETVPKFVSPSDPAAQWTGAHKGTCVLRLCGQLPDRSEGRGHSRRRGDTRDPPGRSRRRKNHDRPHRRSLRTSYRRGSPPTAHTVRSIVDWLVKTKGIAPHIPVWDKSRRDDGTFSRSDFQFDEARNVYVCPTAKTLTTRGTIVSDDQVLYRASKSIARHAR